MGDDFVEIKSITSFNAHDNVAVRLDRHFGKLLLVKVNGEFEAAGRMIDRQQMPKSKGKVLRLSWGQLDGLK